MALPAGFAFIDVVPSLRNFHAKVKSELAKRRTKITVDVDVDRSKLAAALPSPGQLALDLGVEINARDADREVDDTTEEMGRRAKRRPVEVPVRTKLLENLTALGAGAGIGKLLAGFSALPAAVSIVSALAAGMLALASAAGLAAGSVAAVGPAATAAAQVAGTIGLALSGVGKAVKDGSKAQLDSGRTAVAAAAAQQAAAERVRTAVMSVARAQRNASDTAAEGSRRQQQAARSVSDAEQRLASVQRDAGRAQKDLNQARADAARQLADLNREVARASLDERDAVLAVAEAQRALAKVRDVTPVPADPLDLARAQLSLDQAVAGLADVRTRNRELAAEQKKSAAAGIAGNAGVIAATERRAEAERAVTDAVTAVRDAQAEQGRVAVEVSRANSDAVTAVAEAQRDVALALRGATAAQEKFGSGAKNAYAGLNPQAAAFARRLVGLRPVLDRLRASAGRGLFPGLNAGLTDVLRLAPLANRALSDTGKVVGDTAAAGAALVASGPFSRDLASIVDSNVRQTRSYGSALLSLLGISRDLIVTAGPLAERFARFVDTAAARVALLVSQGRSSGRLEAFFTRAGDTAAQLGRILLNVGRGLGGIFGAGLPTGLALLDIIETLSADFATFTASAAGQTTLGEWFAGSLPVLIEVGRLIGAVTAGLGGLADNPGTAALLAQVRTQLLPALLGIARTVGPTLLPALVGMATAIARFFSAVSGGGGPLALALQLLTGVLGVITTLLTVVPGAGEAFSLLVTAALLARLGQTVGQITGLSSVIKLLTGSTLASTAATRAGTVASSAFALATRALGLAVAFLISPVGLIILAAVALVALFVLLYKRSDTFRRVVDGAVRAVGAAFLFLGRASLAAVRTVLGGLGAIGRFIASLPATIARYGPAILQVLTWPYRAAARWIALAWNAIDLRFSIRIPDWVPGLGGRGFTIDDLIPDIPVPQLATGGIVQARRGGTLAMLGEGGYDEAVVPLRPGMGLGGDLDYDRLASTVADALAGMAVQMDGEPVGRLVDRRLGGRANPRTAGGW